ncbi:MAG: hypothetical protein V7641_950 [Blastocatellia bacterium]
MQFKQPTLVQYRFYHASRGIEPLINDARSYLCRIGKSGSAIGPQSVAASLASLRGGDGHAPLCDTVSASDADHALLIHFYHDTYVLQMIAIANKETDWDRLKALRGDNEPRQLGPPILLFQGDVATPLVFQGKEGILQAFRQMGQPEPTLWCRMEAGYLIQLNDNELVMISTATREQAVSDFALSLFPRLMMYQLKASFQKTQLDYLVALMEGRETQQPHLSEPEVIEWQQHIGIVPDLEVETNQAVAFITEAQIELQIIGSKAARTLTNKLRRLRIGYARLAKATSDAEMMADTVNINIKNYSDILERLEVREDGGWRSKYHRMQEHLRESVAHTLMRHKTLAERTRNALAALNEQAQELRDLQAQDEIRLQSAQASLLAAIASLVGMGQLFASTPAMMQLDAEMKTWLLISTALMTFALGYAIFNLRRANTRFDYLCFGTASGATFLTACLWKSRNAEWVADLIQGKWAKAAVLTMGFVMGLAIPWLLGKLIAWWNRRSFSIK